MRIIGCEGPFGCEGPCGTVTEHEYARHEMTMGGWYNIIYVCSECGRGRVYGTSIDKSPVERG